MTVAASVGVAYIVTESSQGGKWLFVPGDIIGARRRFVKTAIAFPAKTSVGAGE